VSRKLHVTPIVGVAFAQNIVWDFFLHETPNFAVNYCANTILIITMVDTQLLGPIISANMASNLILLAANSTELAMS
jgi:hypothetical protein